MMKTSNHELSSALELYFQGQHFSKTETVQSLWSGYGEIARYSYINKDVQPQTCIVKVVNVEPQANHPRGWNTNASHQRKLSSYINERAFYKHFSEHTNDACRVPKLIATSEDSENIWLIMEDLDAAGFALRSNAPSDHIIALGVKWLANFHACFMFDSSTNNAPNINNKANCLLQQKPTLSKLANKVWPIGTYWHLATRFDEWETMPDSELKRAAQAIDNRLNKAKYQTLVHGDAKIANFCIHENKSQLAAVDFQYVGFGVGVKDLVYFLGSCMGEQQLFSCADNWLDMYLAELKKALILNACSSAHQEVKQNTTPAFETSFIELETEYRQLYSFAWADFERFLIGWSPGHHKLSSYSLLQTQQALLCVDNKNY
jgi:hypothetical protein